MYLFAALSNRAGYLTRDHGRGPQIFASNTQSFCPQNPLLFHLECRGAQGQVVPGFKGEVMSQLHTPNYIASAYGVTSKSIYVRLTIGERLIAINGENEFFPVVLLPKVLPFTYESIKNAISKGRFVLPVVKVANRSYVYRSVLVPYLEAYERGEINPRKRVGPKTNRERAEIARRAAEAAQ